jgi:hypothetical protein
MTSPYMSRKAYLSGFYETAVEFKGNSHVFLFLGFFAFAVVFVVADEALEEDSSRTSIRTRGESPRTRCLMVSDKDELGLLSEARPLTAKPLSAVTQTRDGFVCNKSCSAFFTLMFGLGLDGG